MEGSIRRIVVAFLWGTAVFGLRGQTAADRLPWERVSGPRIASFAAHPEHNERLTLSYELVTGTDGADRSVVDLLDDAGATIESKTLGKSKNDLKTVEFVPTRSGRYRIRVSAYRTGIAAAKTAESPSIDFRLPLRIPQPSARNLGDGVLLVTWQPIKEAESYRIVCVERAASSPSMMDAEATEARIEGLRVDAWYEITVEARRGAERVASPPLVKLVKKENEHVWNFTYFGQSSSASVNTHLVLDANDLRLQLDSCTIAANGQIDQKGGKFTAFHDGVSFYYTKIDAANENFELSADFTVNFINPTPDGQEGFGLLAMDSLGTHGVNSVNHYTNSAGIIATKFEAVIDGVKKTAKDTIGARFVSGVSPEVLKMGDAGIAAHGNSTSKAFGYGSEDLVRAGETYRLTLRKTNTGYQVAYRKKGESSPIEFTMYDSNKLALLDKDYDYVGFAAARGCNVTVSAVRMTVTDPRTDPPGRAEPPRLMPLRAVVESPTATGSSEYAFVFTANADGRLSLIGPDGRPAAERVSVQAGVDYTRSFALMAGANEIAVRFELDESFSPGPNQAMGLPLPGSVDLSPVTAPIEFVHTVEYRSYAGSTVHAAPGGHPLGDGSEARPLDLATALAFVQPGQTILMARGIYRPRTALVVQRGNDGTPEEPKTLRAAPGTRPIMDFGSATGGMVVWGDWWYLEGFDITATPGNVKGLQIAGDHNTIVAVDTYKCGDTGLQISGQSVDPFEKWPAHNLVLTCSSWGNVDPAQNNADGFAAKLTAGPGNAFRSCIAYHNIDDGWDLFSKIESGPIGAVLIDSCVAYRNGSLPDGSGNGDGNGFKLGGDGIAVAHELRNSIAFENGAAGITSNSDPAVVLERNTAFGNAGSNISLYGKGTEERRFRAVGNVSMNGGSGDNYREMPTLASVDNYFWNGAQSLNAEGRRLGPDIFESTDTSVVPGRAVDGGIAMRGLFELTPRAPDGVGASIKN